MNSETFLVSVFWQSAQSCGGYSRYNRPCDELDRYGDGFGWVLNSEAGSFRRR